jgi:hypothetical protein
MGKKLVVTQKAVSGPEGKFSTWAKVLLGVPGAVS